MYTKNELTTLLKNNVLGIAFEKVDGTVSEMVCTLMGDHLPIIEDTENKPTKKKDNPDVVNVWNMDKQAWRSFRLANIINNVRVLDRFTINETYVNPEMKAGNFDV
jgi:hypothetical protein